MVAQVSSLLSQAMCTGRDACADSLGLRRRSDAKERYRPVPKAAENRPF